MKVSDIVSSKGYTTPQIIRPPFSWESVRKKWCVVVRKNPDY